MEQDDADNNASFLNDFDERPRSAVNSVVLDYYKKFGRKRDLEQYFSLSTAQSDIQDPRSLFWRRMKEQSDTSDSGEKKSESSNEICRISIKCSIPASSEVNKGDSPSNNDSESPPIITDVHPGPSGDESIDDNHSQKSADGTLDTSMNKPLSPTSSITSQRKLEWDSLADVGYANESDRKTSASSLSTLEREVLAQKQQYTLDYKQSSDLGLPTAHSTPVDPGAGTSKEKKGQERKTISISRKDFDLVEVSLPHDIEKVQPINVNLTKQFSVNLQKDGGMTVDNIKKDITIIPDKNIPVTAVETGVKMDKEIQTSLLRPKREDHSSADCLEGVSTSTQKAPILICLNTLRRMQRRKKIRKSRTKLKRKKKPALKEKIVNEKDKSGEQVSEAESFEYMPGHIYNQNQLIHNPDKPSGSNNNNNNAGNKSSLESSAVHTSDSSKESKYSFSKDLDKTLNVLKTALKDKYDSDLKNKLVTEVIQRLLKSNYGEGEKTPTLLSNLNLNSKKTPTTSTSEADNIEEKVAHSKPKKSILRVNKFNPNNVASTSQSAPNIPSVVNSDKPVMSHLSKITSSTTTETDLSNNSAKDVTSSDTVLAKTSSEELYKKYIDALKREEAYKQHLRDKELFLRQKLVRSETALKVPMQLDVRTNAKLKELIKDLTRNNYDDGSGDASKLEGGSSSNFDIIRQRIPRKHRSHSVFTLSSGNSNTQNQNCDFRNRGQQNLVDSPRAGTSKWVGNQASSSKRPAVTDSSVQVNMNRQDQPLPTNLSGGAKYVCYCTEKTPICYHRPDETYKCHNTMPMTKNNAPCMIDQPMCGLHVAGPSLKDDLITNSCVGHSRKQNIIHECTRCLQTKISIHPKISDPSVSDLNIVHSAECVQLINELYRKVSQTSSECQCSNEKDDCTSNTCKSSKDIMRRYGRNEGDNLIADVNEIAPMTEQRLDEPNIFQGRVGCPKMVTPENISDNIVIPIQGTNMMLKVSIGGKTMKVKDEELTKGDQGMNTLDKEIITDQIKTSLKGTSILDECSKSVQADNQWQTGDVNKNPAGGPPCSVEDKEKKVYSPRKSTRCSPNIDIENPRNNENVFKPNAVRALGCSTYPKTVQINDRKPFVRSNTDTGKLGASSAIQTDTIYNKDKEAGPSLRVETKEGLVEIQSPRTQISSTEHSTSGSSKTSSGNRFQGCNLFKNKYFSEQQKIKEVKGFDTVNDEGEPRDLILDVIKDITQRYSKRDIDKQNKKKCFKEIMKALSYLLDTDDSGDGDQEITKQSPRSKKIQRSRAQSSQSEFVANHCLIEKPRINASYQKGENVVHTLPQKSTRNVECEEKVTMEPLDREGQRNGSSSKTGDDTDSNDFSNPEQAALSSGNKDCMESHSEIEAGSSSKESSKLQNRGITFNSCKKKEISTSGKKSLNPRKHDTKCSMPLETTKARALTDGTGVRAKDLDASNSKKSKCTSAKDPKTTCDRGCGCDGSNECKDCVEPHALRDGTGAFGKNSATSKNQESKRNSAKESKRTCDRGCGCDGSKECKDCVEPHSPRDGTGACGKESVTSKNQESKCNSAKNSKNTCDRGCGCDGSKECKDCVEPHSPRARTGACGKDSATSKNQESKCNSAKDSKKTCDRGCGCDGSKECKDCVEPHSPRARTGACGKDSATSKSQESKRVLPKGAKNTCDRGCGCDGSKECKDCVEPHSPRARTGACGKDSAKSKSPESKCIVAKGAKNTCDRGCGCDGSTECKDCVEPHSLKHSTGKCGKVSEPSRKRERSTSPAKVKSTCDRACGCDSSLECTECDDSHSPNYGIGKCGKKSLRSKKQDRCISPRERKTTCDKGCGCDGYSECKECNHKTGRCGKNTLKSKKQIASGNSPKKFVNRCVQSTVKRVKSLYSHCDDSSDIPLSTDPPCCSTESPTVELVNKIRKECDKYQKRCKSSCKKCEASSSTAVSCDHCKHTRHDHSKRHKCRWHKSRSTEKLKKKCVAYNLIVQTSDSMISEETIFDKCRPLQNVVVRVPRCVQGSMTFKEACAKIEQKLPYCSTSFEPKGRSQSWPNECGVSSTDDVKIANACTVRQYLERNRPDFVDRCDTRQNCIKMTSETRAKESSKLREQLVGLESLQSLTKEELLHLAKELGLGRRRKSSQQKIMSERDMKKHSEKIYKKLPEVIQKKEVAKKESIKRTNLLMADIFKKNLQKKTLNGDVNISNYSHLVKI